MKRPLIVCLVAVFGVCLICYAPSYTKSKYTPTTVITPTYITYCDTIEANGVVSYKDQQVLTSSVPIVASKIYFSDGEFVNKGDVIADVDILSSVFNTMSSISTLSQMSSSFTNSVSDLESFVTQLPNDMLQNLDLSLDNLSFDLPDKVVATASGNIYSINLSTHTPSTELATIVPSNQMIAQISVREEDISKIALGQSAQIYGSAFPGRYYEGKVTNIAKTATKTSGLNSQTVVKVEISFQGDDKIKSGYNIKAKIGSSEQRQILALPYSAIDQDDSTEYVYCFENSRAVKKPITTGVETLDCVEIVCGVEYGDKVLLDSTDIKRDLQHISIN